MTSRCSGRNSRSAKMLPSSCCTVASWEAGQGGGADSGRCGSCRQDGTERAGRGTRCPLRTCCATQAGRATAGAACRQKLPVHGVLRALIRHSRLPGQPTHGKVAVQSARGARRSTAMALVSRSRSACSAACRASSTSTSCSTCAMPRGGEGWGGVKVEWRRLGQWRHGVSLPTTAAAGLPARLGQLQLHLLQPLGRLIIAIVPTEPDFVVHQVHQVHCSFRGPARCTPASV